MKNKRNSKNEKQSSKGIKGFMKKNLSDRDKDKSKKVEELEGPVIVLQDSGEAEYVAAEDEVFESLNGKGKNKNYHFKANQEYFTICVYIIGIIALGAVIVYLVMNFSNILILLKGFLSAITTFIVGIFIAFILNPLVKWVDKTIFNNLFKMKSYKLRAALSIVLTYIVILGLLIWGILYVIPQITNSISELISGQDSMYTDAMLMLKKLEDKLPFELDIVESQLVSLWPRLIEYMTNLVVDVFPKLLTFGISIFMVIIRAFISIAISIYILMDKRKLSKMMTRFVYSIFPVKKASSLSETVKECGSIFSSYIVGKSLDSLIIGILCFILMSIIGLPYAMLLSVIVGLTNMIPYFGPFIGAVPGVLLFLCIRPIDAVVFTLMILALQQFDGWILGPWILGKSTSLSPLWVIFSITLGGAYFGALGMFLGVPVFAVISYLLNRMIDGKLKKKKITIK